MRRVIAPPKAGLGLFSPRMQTGDILPPAKPATVRRAFDDGEPLGRAMTKARRTPSPEKSALGGGRGVRRNRRQRTDRGRTFCRTITALRRAVRRRLYATVPGQACSTMIPRGCIVFVHLRETRSWPGSRKFCCGGCRRRSHKNDLPRLPPRENAAAENVRIISFAETRVDMQPPC